MCAKVLPYFCMCFLFCYYILPFSLQNNRVDCFPFLSSCRGLSERCFLSSFKLPSDIFVSFCSQSLCFGPRNGRRTKMPPDEVCIPESKEMWTPFPDQLRKEDSPTSLPIILKQNRRWGSARHTKRENQLCSKEKDIHSSMLMHLIVIVIMQQTITSIDHTNYRDNICWLCILHVTYKSIWHRYRWLQWSEWECTV